MSPRTKQQENESGLPPDPSGVVRDREVPAFLQLATETNVIPHPHQVCRCKASEEVGVVLTQIRFAHAHVFAERLLAGSVLQASSGIKVLWE